MKPEHHSAPRGRTSRRRADFRDLVQRFLIVCEGVKTEKLYFEAFKVPKDVRGIQVVGTGRNTVSVVQEAIKLKTGEDYDQVWCVFDVEEYPPEAVHQAIRLAKKNGIHVACSNQAFELWYLLHFDYYQTATDRKQYADRLTQLLGFPYAKNRCLYEVLIDQQPVALSNAHRLLQEYHPHNPAKDNPSTTVHRLVQELNRFAPESRAGSLMK